MKNLVFINGTMGVGKTATGKELKKLLPNCVFLDGDWCWDMSPFIVTDETKEMVLRNIGFLLSSFLACSVYENLIFCWVMHEQSIIDDVLSRLNCRDYKLSVLSLICSPEALTERLEKDMKIGLRTEDNLVRSMQRLPNYENMNTVKVDVSHISPEQAAQQIYNYVQQIMRF